MSNIPAAGALRPQAKAKLLAFGLFLAARGVLGGNDSCVEGVGNVTMEVGDDPALLQSRVKVRATAEHEAPLALLADDCDYIRLHGCKVAQKQNMQLWSFGSLWTAVRYANHGNIPQLAQVRHVTD
jgi:hypothetical protein